jgi:hypothetical protein
MLYSHMRSKKKPKFSKIIHPCKKLRNLPLCKVGGIQEERHRDSSNCAGDGNGHDPSRYEEADTLPVDSLEGTIAEANTDCGSGNAHGGRDGEGELRENEDSDGGAHFHAAAARRRVVGDLVAHDCEDC